MNREDKTFDGGMFATPLLGGGNCPDMLFPNFVINDPAGRGEFVALNKHTGEIVYRVPLKRYAWSSPVAIYNRENEMFVFTADTDGHVYIIEGKTGKVVLTQKTGNNFESSPVITGNKIVIGSRGREIYKLSIE
ncbi:MAG: PQQ-like beta-propeller repeat protein [Tannerella sp.]|nr:PQQ-like beta-propeller repeat protein [Tannerella sp.]